MEVTKHVGHRPSHRSRPRLRAREAGAAPAPGWRRWDRRWELGYRGRRRSCREALATRVSRSHPTPSVRHPSSPLPPTSLSSADVPQSQEPASERQHCRLRTAPLPTRPRRPELSAAVPLCHTPAAAVVSARRGAFPAQLATARATCG